MPVEITVVEEARAEDREAIFPALIAFNRANAPDPEYAHLTLLVHDADGRPAGGLWGRGFYQWLFVEYLVVPESMRGQGVGRDLMARAEAWARAKGYVGVWVDTFSFQARPFYEKLGFTVFGGVAGVSAGDVEDMVGEAVLTHSASLMLR